MTEVDWTSATPIPVTELPTVITSYLAAHHGRNIDAEIACFVETATVIDDGRAYTGPEQIRAWLQRATSEYQYTIELTGARRLDAAHYDAIQHLEGDFPGGVADLHYRFTLAGGDGIADADRITELMISV